MRSRGIVGIETPTGSWLCWSVITFANGLPGRVPRDGCWLADCQVLARQRHGRFSLTSQTFSNQTHQPGIFRLVVDANSTLRAATSRAAARQVIAHARESADATGTPSYAPLVRLIAHAC